MPSAKPPYRGRFQAQGEDIDIYQKGGYSHSWARDQPVTEVEGLEFLANIKKECNDSQQNQRSSAFEKAENCIKRASETGGVEPMGKPISMNFFDRKRTIRNARVDLEIHRGKTFIPSGN
ncbi:MAG: hypothetical protein DCF12_05435 [Snowella sp.]|jgi:hypothetical protein|nr:MAG: hypothetical protein DCF12_05435 [Snowella sp.]